MPTADSTGPRMHAIGWRRYPADADGISLLPRHNAAANCDRAELCVHTNTTRRTRTCAAATTGLDNVAGTRRT